jgi:flagellar motor protein MotB
LNKAQADSSGARASADAWKSQLDSILAQGGDLSKINQKLNEENVARMEELASLRAKYEALVSRPNTMVSLPGPLVDALNELAAKYPTEVEFDAARGILKFKSDVTFGKGSAELTPNAKQAIGAFAKVLNSPVAKDYEFMVAGHTDSTPVSNPVTLQAGHRDNWYLSAHRAISVGKDLIGNGVSQRRLGVAGYGAERPIANNGTTEGQAKNRRVEVAILPTTYRGPGVAGGQVTKKAPKAVDLNKDMANIPTGPVLNK